MRKRTTYTLLTVILLLCALAAVLYLRAKAPPEAARLLPEADAIVYLDLKPIRTATHFDRSPVQPSPEFQRFIDATGVNPEHDLDSVAVALHSMKNPGGPNGPVAFSIVWQGHFDGTRLAHYLDSISSTQEIYAGHTIYSIPSSQGYINRVALLDYDTIATSNMPTPEQIHSIMDRQRAAASPLSGCSLLNDRFRDVPAFSTAWAVGHVGLPFVQDGRINLLGLELPLKPDTTFVASLRYEPLKLHGGEVLLQVDQLTGGQAQAEASSKALTNLLALAKVIQQAQQPTARTPSDEAFHEILDSITIEPHSDRATLTATLPPATLKALTSSAPTAP